MKIITRLISFTKGNSLIRKAVIDTNYYLFAQVGSKLLGLLIIPFLVRMLSVEEFAHYDIFLILASLITTLVVLGIDSGIAIMVADHKANIKLLNYLFSYSLILNVFSVVLIWGLAILFFPYFYQLRSILKYIDYLFLYVLFNLISYQVFNFIRWIGRAGLASLIGFISYAIGIVFGFLIIYFKLNPKLSDYLFGIVCGNFIGAISSLFFSYRHLTFRWQSEYNSYFKELLKISLPFVPNYLANNVMMMTDRLMVISILGERSLGIFALANRFAQIPNFAFNIITRGFHPVMYLNYKNESGRSLIKKVYEYCHYAFIPAIFLMYFAAGPIVKIFGGEKYSESASIIPIITMSALIYGIKGLNGMGFSIARKTYLITLISTFSILLNVLFNYILGSKFGILGISIGSLIVACIISILYTYSSEKLYSFGLNLKRSILIYSLVIFISLIIFWAPVFFK